VGLTPLPVTRDTPERRAGQAPAVPMPPQLPLAIPSSYMGEDEIFRDPFTDGFPSRR
jgi:hypothetical protein